MFLNTKKNKRLSAVENLIKGLYNNTNKEKWCYVLKFREKVSNNILLLIMYFCIKTKFGIFKHSIINILFQ